MGLYDRDYYRRDEPPGILSGRSMMWNIIIANVAIFALEIMFSDQRDLSSGPFFQWLELPRQFWDRPWEIWRLFSYGFVHGGFFHLLGNMIGLWCFGQEVEDRYGRMEFLRIYLAMIATGGLVWLVAQRLGDTPGSGVVGASGAVIGMIILGVLPDPKRELMLFGSARVPAWFLAVMLILSDLLGTYQRSGMVAHTVHLAGAAFAAAYFYLGWNLGAMLPSQLLKRLTAPKLRVHKPAKDDPRDLNARVDEILAKIHRSGEASLTNDERRTLEEASKRYQRRQRS